MLESELLNKCLGIEGLELIASLLQAFQCLMEPASIRSPSTVSLLAKQPREPLLFRLQYPYVGIDIGFGKCFGHIKRPPMHS